jgi:hypothetical protein
MNCKKHLKINLNEILFLSSVIIFFSCSEEPKKEDFIARVNDSYLTREEFASLVDTSKLSKSEKDQVINNWIHRELLFQKARKEGIVDEKLYKDVLNRSRKELAAALLINDYLKSEEINISEDELLEYFQKNKSYFSLRVDSYLINKIIFSSEDAAIKFRTLAVESDWQKAVNVFGSDSSLVEIQNSELIEENNLYPKQLARIAKDLYPLEISLVIIDNAGYYSVVQMLAKYLNQTTPPFEVIKDRVEERLTAEKNKKLADDFIKELYSKNEIEIKK